MCAQKVTVRQLSVWQRNKCTGNCLELQLDKKVKVWYLLQRCLHESDSIAAVLYNLRSGS